ncbi:MAG: hypothetical protein R3Y53_06070 [Bacillota bacterium]
MVYLYPEHLAGKGKLLLWTLRDLVVIIVGMLIGLGLAVATGVVYFAVATLIYGFLTMQIDETSIADYLRYAFRFCVSRQQVFYWKLGNQSE